MEYFANKYEYGADDRLKENRRICSQIDQFQIEEIIILSADFRTFFQ